MMISFKGKRGMHKEERKVQYFTFGAQVKPKTIKLAFVAPQVSTQH
jgi:hypothetical protein